MKWQTSLGFSLIFLLFFWSLNNQAQLEKERILKEESSRAMQTVADSLGQKENAANNNQPELKPLDPELGAQPTQPQTAEPILDEPKLAEATAETTTTDSVVNEVKRTIPHQSFRIENERFVVVIDNQGAMIKSIILKNLTDDEGNFPELIQETEKGMLGLELNKKSFEGALFDFDTNLATDIKITEKKTLTFKWSVPDGRSVIRKYTFTPDGDDIEHSTYFENFKPDNYALTWNGGMKETEKLLESGAMGMGGYYFSEVILNNGHNVVREIIEKQTFLNKEFGKSSWIGLRRKYAAIVWNFDNFSESVISAEPLQYKKEESDPGTYTLRVSDNVIDKEIKLRVVILPLLHSDLKAHNQDYDKIIFSGWEWLGANVWFVALCGFVLNLLNIFYGLIPNYGIAIIILTLLIKFATLPLTLKQLRSSKQMQQHKPAVDAIRAKNRANPRKAQEEMMAYYKKVGINPMAQMAGCFTMLLQMPIFIALFVVLGRAIELRKAPFFAWIQDLSIPDVVTDAVTIPFVMPMGLTILPILMAASMYWQSKQTMTDPNMKAMVYIMPVMMLLFAGMMPSGLVLYWTVSNVFSIIQYLVMQKNDDKIEVGTLPVK
jgi:YidC/Oxa1 family membrane protein insertase